MRRSGRNVKRLASAFLALGLVAAAPAAAQAPAAEAPAADWTQRVETTAEGGFRMGNPDAPVKLVEYGSATCGHCAEFAAAANQPLRENYIRSGRVSFEYRPHLLFPSDPGIFLLLGCQDPSAFFETLDRLYATQTTWTARMIAHEQELQAEMERGPFPAAIPAIIRATGVDQLFRERGMTQDQINACLTDRPALQRLGQHQVRAADAGVTGTPTFFINGRIQDDVVSWNDPRTPGLSLENRLRAAIGS